MARVFGEVFGDTFGDVFGFSLGSDGDCCEETLANQAAIFAAINSLQTTVDNIETQIGLGGVGLTAIPLLPWVPTIQGIVNGVLDEDITTHVISNSVAEYIQDISADVFTVTTDLNIINEGVQKSSILVPHTTDL